MEQGDECRGEWAAERGHGEDRLRPPEKAAGTRWGSPGSLPVPVPGEQTPEDGGADVNGHVCPK